MTKPRQLQKKQTELKPPQLERLKTPTLAEHGDSQKALALILYDVFQACSIYGKEPEAFESINRIFNLILGEYTLDQVRDGIKFYLKSSKGFPEAGDIACIIERGMKPPFERSVYISITKKHADERKKEEWQYLKEYENFIVTGKVK